MTDVDAASIEVHDVKEEGIESSESVSDVIKTEESAPIRHLTLQELESKFSDRYSERDDGYASVSKGFDPVICVHPWADRPKRNFDYNNRGRGGWRGGWDNRGRGRGGWQDRGGRGGGWRGNRGGGWNNDRKRHSDSRDQYGDDKRQKVYYPGQNR